MFGATTASRVIHAGRPRTTWGRSALSGGVILALAVALPARVGAQAPGWTASLLVQPFPSPFIADWERNPQMAVLTLIYSGSAPQDFRVEGWVQSAERGELARVISPTVSFGFGPVTQIFTSADILDWETVRRDQVYVDQVLRTGMIPEGRHQMCARVLDPQSVELVSTCADFTIALPEPPQLIFPANKDVVAGLLPVFQWTPIFLPPEVGAMYRLRLFELLRDQVPETAALANPVWFETETTAPLAIYPLDALPLDPMKQYVWQVEALDGEGNPVTRGGRSSEIWTFAVGGPGRELGETKELPDALPLIPGVATLTGLQSAQVSKDDFSYVVNGWLDLELETPVRTTVRVEAVDLEIDRTGVPQLAIVRAGDLRGTIKSGGTLDAGSFVRFTDIAYDPGRGLTLGAELALPGVRALAFSDRAQVTAAGLFGNLSASAAEGAVVTRLGRIPLEYVVTGGRLTLPLHRLELAGRVRLIGADLDCPATGTVADDVATVPVLCQPEAGFTPGGPGTRPLVAFGVIAGTLTADFLGDRLDGELRSAATLRVFGDASEGCTVGFTLVLASDLLKREDERGDCDAGRARADFGWVTMGLSDLRLERFDLDPAGRFSWRALVNLAPEAVGAENLQLPYVEDVVLDESGVSLPSSSSDAPGTGTTGVIEIDSVQLLPRTMGFVGGLVPYERWLSGKDPGFEWGSATSWIRFPHVTSEQSSCLNDRPFEVDTLVIKTGRIDVTLEDHGWENGCVLRLGSKLHVRLSSVTGSVAFTLGDKPKVTELPLIAGEWLNPDPECGLPLIGCAGGFLATSTLTGDVKLTPNGRLQGTAEDFLPSWISFDLRFAKLDPAGGRLELAVSDSGSQSAVYDGPVKVTFDLIEKKEKQDTTAADSTAKADSSLTGKATDAAKSTAAGVVSGVKDTATVLARIDVITNRLLSGDIVLNGPFKLQLGFLKFIIDRATLSPRGLLVDGRERLLVDTVGAESREVSGRVDTLYRRGTDSVGVTFAGVYLDPVSGDITSGAVGIGIGLALESSPGGVGLAGGALTAFAPVRAADPFDPKNSTPDGFISSALSVLEGGGNIRLTLPGTVALGAGGFRVEGRAPARVSLRGSRFDSASVTFEDGFAVQPVSGRVTAGRAQVRVREYPIAHLDAAGWHLSIAELLTTVIPDTLPLFDKATAFVPLKDANGNLLVQVDSVPEGTRIRTRTGETLRLVVPALRGSRPAAPALGVTFDLVLERGSYRPIAGSLHAVMTTGSADGFPTADFPFVLDSIDLRAAQNREPSFLAYGRLALLNGQQPLRIALGLKGGGALEASLEQVFTDDLALVPGVSRLRLGIDTLRFQASGRLDQTFAWRLELPGRITLTDPNAGQPTRIATATFRLSPAEAALVNFASPDSLFRLPLPGADLLLGRFRAPLFRWDIAQSSFDFEFLFDAALEIPALDSLRLPEMRDIRITPQGVVIPAFELASVSGVRDPNSPFESGTDTVRALRVGNFAVRALAYRFGEVRWNWAGNAPPPSLDFGVDLEFAVEDIPSGLGEQAARLTIRALDVGITNGRVTGSFERVDFPRPLRTPVADIRAAFGTFSVAEGQTADVRIGLEADLRLPNLLTCPAAVSGAVSLASATDTLFLAGNGTIYGSVRDVLPTCTFALGPLEAELGSSTVRFGYDAPSSAVSAELDASVTVRLPGDQQGETVSATGRLVLDLVRGQVIDAQASIDEPFYWAPDPANPFLRLVVNQASLSQRWLQFGAAGQLRTDQGAGVDVAFENVAFDLNAGALASGRIRLTGDAAVGIEIPQSGGLLFGVFPASEPRSDGVSARIVLPGGAVIDTAGIHLLGTATASLGYGGETYAALSATFDSAFTIGFAPTVAITGGRLDLKNAEGDLIAYVDRLGFWPGNVFAVLPIPARLGLPDDEIAYLQLRSPSDTALLLVETVFSSETVRVRTRPNQQVDLVLPALADQGAAPVVRTSLDLVLNARNLQPVSGEIVISSQPDAPLVTLPGYPVEITQLGYRGEPGGYRLRLGARAVLPGPLDDIDLVFQDLELTADGLRGTAELGQYSETFVASAPAIAEAQFKGDTLAVTLTGARLTLAPANNVVQVSGAIRSAVFRAESGAPRAIHLTARVDAQGFRGTADVSDRETPIPIGVAALTLESAQGQPAIVVEATTQEFAVRLGGTLRLPTVAPGFALTVRDFKVGSAGVSLPDISITAPTSTAEFELFGARFALRDSVVGATQVAPAVGVAIGNGAVRLTMSGYVTLLRNTTRFIGLQIGTDGTLALQGADFLSRPIDIIPTYARLTRARITSGALELGGDVKLPAPFTDQAPQQLTLVVLPDGRVTGGGRVILVSEPEGLGTARTKVTAGMAAFHLRYLDLALDFQNEANTAASMVADVYVQEQPNNLLRFGSVSGGTVTPGIRVAVNGAVTWGGLAMPNPIVLRLDPVTLTLRQATARTVDSGFAVSLGGELALAVTGGSGSLAFRDVGFTSAGEIRMGEASFDGGTFTIQEKVKLVVGRVAWNTQPTTIYVPVAAPPASNGSVRRDSVQVTTRTYVDFGATVDVAGVFTGGVERVLVYVRNDDATTHLLIQNLQTQIPDIIEFRASLAYDELPDGFDLSLATSGTLLKRYEAAMVGVMRRRANQFSAGIFLMTSVEVPLVPGVVTLTGVGGGLFINPAPADLALVKNVAGLNGPSADRLGMPPAAQFAVMLYASVDIVGAGGASAASGRAMLTVTDRAAQLNAMATFFKMDRQISGDLALQVGWSPAAYVRGDVSLVVDIDNTLEGIASIQFFAGSNTFAVKGNVDLTVVKVLTAYAEVIVVPSGFTANMGFSVSKSTDIVSVSVAANLRIWYRPSTNDLGAYLKLVGQATAFGITGELGLIGALVIQPELAIYAQGYARVVGVDILTFEVWAQYTPRGLAVGLGRNEELAAVLARAEQVAAELEAEADRILAGIDAAAQEIARTPIPVSRESLAAAYANFQRWNWVQMLVLWRGFRAEEEIRRGGLLPASATDPYVSFYERILSNSEAAADTAQVVQLRAEAAQKLAVIADRRAGVEARIRSLRLQLLELEETAAFAPPTDPVTTWSAGSPALVEGPPGPDGTPTMVVTGVPVFELDDQAAATARSTMTAAQAATLARQARMRDQIAAVETGLTTVLAATSATDANSFASYARLHSDAVEAIERQHAVNVEFRMRRRAWAQTKLDTLAREQPGLAGRIANKLTEISAYQQTLSKPGWARRFSTGVMLDSLAWSRARWLSAWAENPALLDTYNAEAASWRTELTTAGRALQSDSLNGAASARLDLAVTWFNTQAANYGMRTWWEVGDAGLTQARDGAQTVVQEAVTAADLAIRPVRDQLAALTASLASLNGRQAQLYGVLYDLYDDYLRVYGSSGDEGQQFTARRTALAEMLQAPRVTSPRVVVTDYGFLSSIATTWSGTHPRGVYEYLLQEGDDSLHSVGGVGAARRWVYSALPAGGTFPRSEQVHVRGGAGLTANALASYTLTFAATPLAAPRSTVTTPPADVTPPTRPVVDFVGLTTLVNANGVTEAWTSDSTRVTARWTASDVESGIAEYEYRVTTYPPTTSQTTTRTSTTFGTYTTAQPVAPVVVVDWTSAGGRTSAAILGLRLRPGQPYYVEVRARNGAGLVGDGGGSPTLRLDPTPPAFPAGTPLMPPVATFTTLRSLDLLATAPPVAPACGTTTTLTRTGSVERPVWDGRLVTVTPDDGVVGGGAWVRLTLSRPDATDPETGIYGYNYLVDSVAPGPVLPNDGWADIPEATATFVATGPRFLYGRPRWVSLVALNALGVRSAPVTYGPVTVPDPTIPSRPVFCGGYGSGIIAYLTTPAVDDETGVRGYQIRVRDAASGATVRPFPSGATVDWPASQALANTGVRIPFTPTGGWRFIVDLRAVSGLGVPGDVASSGDVYADATPPVPAGVSGRVVKSTAELTLTVQSDPESGLGGIDIAFGTAASEPTLSKTLSGTYYTEYVTYPVPAGTSVRTIALPSQALAFPELYAFVRVRNGAGIASTVAIGRIK